MKRLRKAHYSKYGSDRKSIKYFMCGEYGSRFQRPHYHVLLFNVDVDLLYDSWKDKNGLPIGEIWIDPRQFDPACVIYTCGYMLKPCLAGHGRDTREKKFTLMSKRLGDNYLTPEQMDFHWRSADRNYITMLGGVKCALPRYYADKIFKPRGHAGYICPVSRLACNLFKEEREVLLDASTRKAALQAYRAHVDVYGNADDFIRSQGEARRASIINFQKKAAGRNDV
jgi:hypothetical protein